MTKQFIVVHEAEADFTTATELADRVLVAEIEWLDDTLLDTQRQWVRDDPSGNRMAWTSVPSLAKELGLSVRGLFGDGPAMPDARAARRAIAYILRRFDTVDAILLIRDMDNVPQRRDGLKQGRDFFPRSTPIVIGAADVERESWVISGFEPKNADEQSTLAEESQALGFNPCRCSNQLFACSEDQAKRSPKRVLAALTGRSWDRQRECWQLTPLAVLEERGGGNGLKDYLGEIRQSLVPLITGYLKPAQH